MRICFHQCFHAPSHNPVSAEALAEATTQENLHIGLSPSLQVFCSTLSVYEIWKYRTRDSQTAPQFQWQKPEHLIFTKRSGDEIFIESVSASTADVIERLQSIPRLETALENMDVNPTQVQEAFGFMASRGLIANLSSQ